MASSFSLRSTVSPTAQLHELDVLTTKRTLAQLGYYEIPVHGITPWPDSHLFKAIKRFQSDNGLRKDGIIKPGGETAQMLRSRAPEYENMPYFPNDEGVYRIIDLPQDDLIPFKQGRRAGKRPTSQVASGGGKSGTYIWRTQGDGKVRPSHAERDGEVFSWDDPPEGGHPGEALNCRCTAEEISCTEYEVEAQTLQKEFLRAETKVENLRRKIEGKKSAIEVNKADIRFYHAVNNAADKASLAGLIPHPLGRFVGFVFSVGENISESILRDLEAELANNEAELRKLEHEFPPLLRDFQNARIKHEESIEALEQCQTGKFHGR